jgi:hypothetical protein
MSFSLDVGGLDNRPPFLDLGRLKGGQRLGRQLIAREKLVAQTRESRTHRRIGERVDNSSIELPMSFTPGFPLACSGNPRSIRLGAGELR